ncbi:hypothetical protein DS608_21695 [Salmonella enterica subsp. enterica serovar Javiana]|nr:hypothetical protein [Salmonella enterica subsp. enterica serovar Javiana]
MNFPTSYDEWQERFKDGLTWADVEEAYHRGIMRIERYHHAFKKLVENRVWSLPVPKQIEHNAEHLAAFRYHWNPFPAPTV